MCRDQPVRRHILSLVTIAVIATRQAVVKDAGPLLTTVENQASRDG